MATFLPFWVFHRGHKFVLATMSWKTASGTNAALREVVNKSLASRIGNKKHILLYNVPKTATPSDVLRTARQCRVENIIGASLDYHYFEPTGQAYIELSKTAFMEEAIKVLSQSSISGSTLKPFPFGEKPSHRQRGPGGRAQAAERGVLKGDGPAAGIDASGHDVVVKGLPSKTTPEELKAYLTENKLVEEGLDGKGLCEVLAPEPPKQLGGSKPRTRMYVKMQSMSAAQELAKRLNMTYYQPLAWGSKMPIKARVAY